jgi:hypothetical protein
MQANIQWEFKTGNFRYFWLKYVSGFNQKVHCAQCLKGAYSRLIQFRQKQHKQAGNKAAGRLDEYPTEFVYLCGVSNRGWADNLHVAMRFDSEASFSFEDHNIKVFAAGVERVTIHPVSGADLHVPKAFWSCRNWQFGHEYFPEHRLPFGQEGDTANRIKERENARQNMLF